MSANKYYYAERIVILIVVHPTVCMSSGVDARKQVQLQAAVINELRLGTERVFTPSFLGNDPVPMLGSMNEETRKVQSLVGQNSTPSPAAAAP